MHLDDITQEARGGDETFILEWDISRPSKELYIFTNTYCES
jgi:hypothetical protein